MKFCNNDVTDVEKAGEKEEAEAEGRVTGPTILCIGNVLCYYKII